jgi:FtsP/CotA-like multicopper oxidase with cupredoxin domain
MTTAVEMPATRKVDFMITSTGISRRQFLAGARALRAAFVAGAFIIEPKDKGAYPAFDKEYTMILGDGALGYTLNGHGFPGTEVLTANKGEKLQVRFMNEGLMIHPMHLHGIW